MSERQRRESNGGPARICTLEGVCQQIYSLPRLTTSVPTHEKENERVRGV